MQERNLPKSRNVTFIGKVSANRGNMRKINSKIDKVFLLLFSGCLMGFGSFLVLMLTFLTAYFSKAKGTIVYIDKLGEANLELFMIFVLLGFFIICLIYGLKRIFAKKVTDEI